MSANLFPVQSWRLSRQAASRDKEAATGRWAPNGFPWWISPAGLNLGFLLPIMLIVASLGSSAFNGMTVRGVWFLTPAYIALGVLVLLVTALAGWMGAQVLVRTRAATPGNEPNWDMPCFVLGVIALAAYIFWFHNFITNPHMLIQALTGAYKPDRDEIGKTAGLTSLTNLGPVFFCIYSYRLSAGHRMPRPMHIMFVLLLGATLFRVYAWSERLALIEALLPFGLALMARLYTSQNRLMRIVVLAGPFFAIPLLVMYFGAAEYFRSWSSGYYHDKLPFWEFAVGRITSYYVTSLNNGAGILATSHWPAYQFEYVLDFLHKAPGIGPFFSDLVGFRDEDFGYFLRTYGDEEFNNPSGIYAVIYDLGIPLGLAYFAITSFAAGVLYRSYAAERPAGILLYPMFFLTFLEVFRYPYLGQSRAFTWFLGILLAFVLIRTPRWVFTFGSRRRHVQVPQHA